MLKFLGHILLQLSCNLLINESCSIKNSLKDINTFLFLCQMIILFINLRKNEFILVAILASLVSFVMVDLLCAAVLLI